MNKNARPWSLYTSRTIITALLAVLTFTCCMAREKKPAIKARLKGYPSGAIDEYEQLTSSPMVLFLN